jgi:hypothetical protein
MTGQGSTATRLTLNRHTQEYFAAMHSVPAVKRCAEL